MGNLYSGTSTESSVSVSETSKSALKRYQERMDLQFKQLLEREEALKRVSVQAADVDLLMAELGWAKPLAERILRQHNGDLKALVKVLCS